MSARQLRNYVEGQWVEAGHNTYLPVENPTTCEIIAEVPLSGAEEVARAVDAAAAAFPGWSQTPAARRVQPMFKLAALLRENEESISRVMVEEMGKSLPDARAEMKRVIENVEVACGMPVMQQGDTMVGASFDIDGEVLRLPVGVFGIIAPFNFPAMIPFWFLPTAIATGNTVVLKASEQVPCTMELITRHIDQIGLPPGVFNLINGDKDAAIALTSHPRVSGISFVGSSRVGRQVAKLCTEQQKRYQVLGSAKNHLVVMPDARLDEVIRNMVTSCFGCAGQRCMAASAIVTVGEERYREVTRRFIEASRKVLVADPLDPAHADEAMLMGPVISSDARDRILALIERGVTEGATLALDGRDITVPGCERGHFIGPTVFTEVKPGMEIHRTEIFGPVVVMMKAATLDEAIDIINEHCFGNGASIYTNDGHWARRFKLEARAGMIGINVGIPAPVAHLPFGGMRDSMMSDIKAQGVDGIQFYTEKKIVTKRYFEEEG